MSNTAGVRSLGRASGVLLVAFAALGFAGTATAAQRSSTATGPKVTSWSPHAAAKGAKVTFRGTDLAAVTGVTWVTFPGPKDLSAKILTKSATSIVAIAPVTFPSKTAPGEIEFKSKTGTTLVACWGACG